MIRLGGETYYALLRRAEDGSGREFLLYTNLRHALNSWGSGGRLSPIFPFEGSVLPTLEDGENRTVLLLGPLFPGGLPEGTDGDFFLTLGLYNILWIGHPANTPMSICEDLNCAWERWTLTGTRLTEPSHRPLPQHSYSLSVPRVPRALMAAAGEYAVNLRAIFERSRGFPPKTINFIHRFAKRFTPALVKNTHLPLPARQTEIVLANAALSRYSSQTFSGTSPLAETECHFWSHSLFGIGSASLALVSVRTFVEQAFSRAQLINRLLALRNEPPNPQPLISNRLSDTFWLKDHLASYDSQESFQALLSRKPSPSDTETIPLLTCFSGRDGFRSTRVSLSAPLETLSSGNTPAWSLLTLTHEMSHPIIEALLGLILPRKDPADVEEILAWFGPEHSPQSLFDQIREYMIHSLAAMTGRWDDLPLHPKALRGLVHDKGKELNELLAHALDFLYFYGRDPARYLSGIWLTWGAVPNIEHRVHSYLIRTLCALHTVNTQRPPRVTVEQTLTHLTQLIREHPRAPYIKEAAQLLRDDDAVFEEELRRRAHISAFARAFLYSETLAKVFETISVPGASRGTGKLHRPLWFPPERIDNPLSFVEDVATDRNPNHARSAWLLTMLAFTHERD